MSNRVSTRQRLIQLALIIGASCLLASCQDVDSVSNKVGHSQADVGTEAVVAETIYINGKIYTLNDGEPWAEALAVDGGKIIGIGSVDAVMAVQGEETQIVDLQNRMVMPGIHDTHMHPLDAGLGSQVECAFPPMGLDFALKILKNCLADLPEGDWLRGGQWNDVFFSGELSEGKLPKQILDEIAPNHPVFLMDWSVHNAWVNSLALEMLGIDSETSDPSGGVIVRDTVSGEATGILLDNAAYDYRRALPQYSIETRTEALVWSIETMAEYGVTTFKDALTTRSTMEAYQALAESDQLPLRVKTNLTWKSSWANSHEEELELIADRWDLEHARISTGFAKIMLDGVPLTYTSALLEPYEPSEAFGSNYLGKLMHDPDQLKKDVIWLDAQGITVKMHATGDRAVRVALDAIEAARDANGDSGLIHEVSHAEMVHADDIPRFKQLNVAAEMCPILWYPIFGLDWSYWLGEERGKVWPIRTMVESGALVIYGSDWPVVPSPNPWVGIESMVTRSDPANNELVPDWPEQAIDLATVIQIFTLNGAISNRVGDTSGSLDIGKDADFIVLDRNVFEIAITDVGETQVLLSVVDGEVVVNNLLEK